MLRTILTQEEIKFCKKEAYGTWAYVKQAGLGEGHGDADQDVSWELAREKEFNGKFGECAIAKLCGRRYEGEVGDFGAVGDVGKIQARGTTWRDGHLIVYKGDLDDQPLVLVTIDAKKTDYENPKWCPELGLECRVIGYAPNAASFYREAVNPDTGLPQYPAKTPRPGGRKSWWIEQRELIKIDTDGQLVKLANFGFQGDNHDTQRKRPVQHELFWAT